MTITTAQIRGARGILNWSQGDLAERTGISATSIGSIENGQSKPRTSTLATIKKAFEDAGIEFLPGSGLRQRSETINILEGPDSVTDLLDDIYYSVISESPENREVLIYGLEEKINPRSKEHEIIKNHINRLLEAGITERIILKEGDKNFMAPDEFYRWIGKEYFSPYPFLIYANKMALINWDPPMKVLVIDNPVYSQTFKKIFDLIWKYAITPE